MVFLMKTILSRVNNCLLRSNTFRSMSTKRIGLVQMTCTSKKEENFEQCEKLIKEAHRKGAEMVFLPECFDYIGESKAQSLTLSEPLNGPLITKYKNLASGLGIWLSLGGFHETGPESHKNRVWNAHLIIDKHGHLQGRYCKTHLFHVDIPGKVKYSERELVIPGSQIGPIIDTVCGRIGMAICYDVRFPELSLALRQQGAEILTYPSAFTVPTGNAHWEVLLRNRAIENQCYVIAAAQVGKHNSKRSSYGHSMVVDPWGKVIAELPTGVGVCMAEIDIPFLHRIRQEMPLYTHHRHDLYGHMYVELFGEIDCKETYRFGDHEIKSSQLFFRTSMTMAFVNIKPVVPGHVLIAPLRRATKFTELIANEISDLFTVAQKVQRVIEQIYNTSSCSLVIQDGPDAGQSVNHLHIHILPRKPGDFENNDDLYTTLESHDKDMKSGTRTEEEMAAESHSLRPYFAKISQSKSMLS
ncbi:deaminated glutathione amidase-like [Tubulanus polymorphus]|uniref:deaminated glutathione amidase-like n=1 Tax=Tubulanus polymorphus TaxID=672921 RepID=UPI003DA5778F